MNLAERHRSTFGWPRLGGAILVLFVVAGCGTSDGSARPSGSTTVAASSPAASDAGTAGSPGTASLDPGVAQRFTALLAPMRAASQFTTTVSVDGKAVLTASGRSLGDASRTSVTTGGKTVEYIQAPPKAWARDKGGQWVLLDQSQAPTSPVDVLASPTALGSDGADLYTATYPAAALGLTGDPIAVSVRVDGTKLTFHYETTTDDHQTVSETVLTPGPDDPIPTPAP